MANNLVVQLLLKTGTFSTDLKQARGQIQNFQQGCQTAGKSVSAFSNALGINVGALTKLGGAVGIAVAAGKELKSILSSTQTTADAFQGVIAGCTGVLDAFNRSIATADFSAFNNGLWGIYDAAKAARDALDDLQDAQAFYGLLSSENRTKFMNAQEGFRDPDSTNTEKQQYITEMEAAVKEGYDLVSGLQKKTLDNYKAQIQKFAGSANVELQDINFNQLKDVAKEFLADSEAAASKYKNGYEQMLKDRNEYKVPWYQKQDLFGPPEYNNIPTVNSIKRQNADIVVGRAILEMKDEDRNALIETVKGIESAEQGVLTMQMSLDRSKKSMNKSDRPTGTTPKTQKEELQIMEGSLTYWKNILADETKYRDALVKNSDEWNYHNTKVEEAQEMIKGIEGVIKKTIDYQAGSITFYKNALDEATQLRDSLELGSEEWEKQNEYVKILAGNIQTMENMYSLNDALNVTPPTIESLQTAITLLTQLRNNAEIGSEDFKYYGEMIELFKKHLDEVNGVKPEIKAPDTSQWDKFNQSMSNTATIVSSLSSTFKEGAEVTAASVLQMVATCLPAIGSLISSLSALTVTEAVEAGTAAVGKAVSTSKHWIEAIAAVASLGAVVAAAIAAASKPSTKKYATGGIVGGNSFTGDRVPAMVNSGEMILNKTQQARLFQMANSGSTGGQVEFHISGTELVGVLSNVNRKNRVIR